MEPLHFFELHLIKIFQEIRTPWLDQFFKFFNLIDTGYFVFFIVPIVWMGFNWKWGLRLLYILFLNFFFNEVLKILFHQPRPYDLDPSVAVIHVPGGGMPSGTGQSAIIYLGLLVIYLKNKKWAWILGLNLLFWMSLSRIYLGVHFFSDILGGYVVGLLLLMFFYYLFPKIEKYLTNASNYKIFALSLVFSALMFFLSKSVFIKAVAITSIFVSLGTLLSSKYKMHLPTSLNFWEGAARTIFTWVGMGLIALVFGFNLKKLSSLSAYLAMCFFGLWLSLFASFFWKKTFGRLKRFKNP